MIENRARELAAQDRVAVAHDYEVSEVLFGVLGFVNSPPFRLQIQLRHAKREIHATRQECTKLKEDVALLEGREKMLEEDHRKEIAALQVCGATLSKPLLALAIVGHRSFRRG